MAYILVIDDDQTMRELLEIVLSDEGYEVGTAASASSALEAVDIRHPDLFLLDLKLRGEAGEGFIQAYRALPNATSALILLSAASDLDQVAVRSGADRYLAKPFELDDLLDLVAKSLHEVDQTE